jgi:hypothetical protein
MSNLVFSGADIKNVKVVFDEEESETSYTEGEEIIVSIDVSFSFLEGSTQVVGVADASGKIILPDVVEIALEPKGVRPQTPN